MKKQIYRWSSTLILALTWGIAGAQEPSSPPAEKVPLRIAAGPMGDALNEFGRQSGLHVVLFSELGAGFVAPKLEGEFTPGEALERLLANTGLRFKYLDPQTIAVLGKEESAARGRGGAADASDGGSVLRLAQGRTEQRERVEASASEGEGRGEDVKEHTVGESQEEEDAERSGIPEILVTGSKLGTLNTDIRRTADDTQPYVILDRAVIERSGAQNLDDLLRKQLPMSAATLSSAVSSAGGSKGSINLRGLGSEETLILVDGRRVPSFVNTEMPHQSDINGIPLDAIERVEILPTTASGIYGGSATGGVVNIILRRDYAGIETKVRYGNTFESDVATRAANLSAGFNLENGRTNVLLVANYASSNPLLGGERNLVQRGVDHILATNPETFYAAPQPPLGATTNIRSTTGANLVLDDGTPLNSPVTHVPNGYAGVSTDGGLALLANAGRYNFDRPNTAQDGGLRRGLSSGPETASAMATLRREFTPNVQVFLETFVSESSTEFPYASPTNGVIPANALNNPFQQDIRVTVPGVGFDSAVVTESRELRAVGGIIMRLPRNWQSALDLSWNRSRSSQEIPGNVSPTTTAGIANGSVDVVRDVNEFPVSFERNSFSFSYSPAEATLTNAMLRLAGPLPWPLSTGAPSLSVLFEYRKELFDDFISTSSNGTSSLRPSRQQSIGSVYLETTIPLLPERRRDVLALQLAVRRDEYKVTGATGDINLTAPSPVVRFTNRNSSIDPTIGLKFKPAEDILLRASYGTGYLPPSVMQLVPDLPRTIDLATVRDPLRGNEPLGSVELLQGGSPDLRPEESESYAFGLVFTPRWMQGFRISADWSRIEKVDNIGILGAGIQDRLNQTIQHFPERITRGPPSNGFAVGPLLALDSTSLNIARMNVESLDLTLEHQVSTGHFGEFAFSAAATKLIEFETQSTPSAAVVDSTGVFARLSQGTLEWNATGSLNWAHRGWSLGWRSRFADSYFLNSSHSVIPAQGAAKVPHQIYHDISGGYRFGSRPASSFGVLDNLEIQFGVNNVLNEKPPIDVATFSFPIYYSALGDPLLANYYLTVKKSFGWN